MSVIELRESAEYTMRVDLDDIPCVFRVYWNEFSDSMKPDMSTDGFWAMDLSNEIFDIKGIKLVTGAELMWPYSHANFGGFFLYDMSLKAEDPEFEGIGTRWQLNYIPIDELFDFRVSLRLETI